MIHSPHRSTLLLAAAALIAACANRPPAPRADVAPACDAAAARQVVEGLGGRMKQVSLLAPDSLVVQGIRDAYAPFVTDSLLSAWAADPARAPGRRVSSPWPERIEVQGVVAEGEACRVTGEIVYVTSAELENGGAVARVPVTLRVVDGDGWRVAAYAAEESQTP